MLSQKKEDMIGNRKETNSTKNTHMFCAKLLEKIIGEEEVEKMDGLLSLAITGGDCNWI